MRVAVQQISPYSASSTRTERSRSRPSAKPSLPAQTSSSCPSSSPLAICSVRARRCRGRDRTRSPDPGGMGTRSGAEQGDHRRWLLRARRGRTSLQQRRAHRRGRDPRRLSQAPPLEHGEADLRPGDAAPPVVDTRIGRLAVVICYDLEFPELTRALALAGTQLLAVPTNWRLVSRPPGERPPEVVIAMAAARVSRMAIACADRLGVERGQQWAGGATIVDVDGWVVAETRSPGLLFADLDLRRSHDKRIGEHADAFTDRRPRCTPRSRRGATRSGSDRQVASKSRTTLAVTGCDWQARTKPAAISSASSAYCMSMWTRPSTTPAAAGAADPALAGVRRVGAARQRRVEDRRPVGRQRNVDAGRRAGS